MKSYLSYLSILDRIKKDASAELMKRHQLRCETGDWLDSAVLKLQKEGWADNGLGQGVFFSVWIGDQELKKKRFNYNIHALKLRLRKGYSIEAGEFAAAFRKKVAPGLGEWPNLRTDFGPQTLMQGWAPADPASFRGDVLGLMDRFVSIHGVIDKMLEERKRRSFPNKAIYEDCVAAFLVWLFQGVTYEFCFPFRKFARPEKGRFEGACFDAMDVARPQTGNR